MCGGVSQVGCACEGMNDVSDGVSGVCDSVSGVECERWSEWGRACDGVSDRDRVSGVERMME